MYNLFAFAGRIMFISSTKHGRQWYVNQDFAKGGLDPKAKICVGHVEEDLEVKPPSCKTIFKIFLKKLPF